MPALRSPKLATKLIAALLIPLMAVGLLAALLVGSFNEDVVQADAELDQVRASIALSQLGVAIRDELSAIAFVPLASVTLDLNYEVTDQAFAEAEGIVGTDVTILRTYQNRILDSRETLGNRPATIRRWLNDEVLAGESDGLIGQQVSLYREASAAFLQSATFDSPENLSGEAAASLATVQLISNYNAAIQSEYDAFQAFRRITDATVDRQVQTLAQDVRFATIKSEAAQAAIFAIGSPELRRELSTLRNTQEFAQTEELRNLVTTDLSGNAPTTRVLRLRTSQISGQQLTNSIWSISSSLDILRFQSIQDLEAGAESRRNSAQLALQGTATFAVLLSLFVVVLGFLLYRSIRRPIRDLTHQARRIASHDLPEVVALMRAKGSDAQIPPIVPIDAEADDEIGALVSAFNQMHSASIELAGEQAAARATVADMFVNLGRRNQKLLLRLLNHMDSLERGATNADVLEELFKVDHLATRMRRNAESLLVLAGARSTRHFERPAPLSSILRASLSEVDGYERVHLNIADDVLIEASAIADLSHLVAELVENAITFSPPSSRVEIAARRGEDSLLLAIADQGIGMTAEELDAANDRIAAAAQNTETPSKYLGHYVSGRLAARHDLELKLIPGMPHGLICRIRIPHDLIAVEDSIRPAPAGSVARETGAVVPQNGESNPFVIPSVVPILGDEPSPELVAPGLSAPANFTAETSEVTSAISVPSAFTDAAASEQDVQIEFVPPKPQHRLAEPVAEAPAVPASIAPLERSPILPGSAPVVITTDGPTSGSLAGARRRVPTSDRTGSQVAAESLPATPNHASLAAGGPVESEAPASTDGPTSGSLAGVRRRVPTSERTGSQVAAESLPAPATPASLADSVPVESDAPASTGGLVSSGRRRPGANMPKGVGPRESPEIESQQAQTMDEALTLTRSADSVASSFAGLQAAFQRAEQDSAQETLENLEETAEGII